MADDSDTEKNGKKRGKLLPLLLGLILAAAGAGAGFWAVTAGPFAPEPAPLAADSPSAPIESEPAPVEVAFVPLETVIISLGPEQTGRHLIFTAELEVDPAYETEVARLTPRVLDVLNTYLRVISLDELSTPASLARLRAQMLRRIQIVTGAGRVQDLLVTQFVVN
jgi:flagellar FliL protein